MTRRRRTRDSSSQVELARPSPETTARRFISWEAGFVVVLVVLGVSSRIAFFERTSIEHFDEGVYASNLFFDDSFNFQYPMRHLYAPPLLPALIEAAMIAFGEPTSRIAMIPSLVFGCATLLVVWWLVRTCFNRESAVAALCLIAFSDVHIMFSRAALTDSPLLCFFVGAIYLLHRASVYRTASSFLLAGLVVGLAWWTKYNGWLPLLIALPAFLTQFYLDRVNQSGGNDKKLNLAVGWIIAALSAVLIWSPYLYSLQEVGGYQAVANNHRQYLVGVAGWSASLEQQLANLRFVDSVPGNLSLGTALLSAWLMKRLVLRVESGIGPITTCEFLGVGTIAAGFSLTANIAGTSCVSLVLAAAATGILTFRYIVHRKVDHGDVVGSPTLFISWFFVLAIMTPLYTPFLRLVLPWLVSAWVLSSWMLGLISLKMIAASSTAPVSRSRRTILGWSLGLAGILALFFVLNWRRDIRPFAWRDDRRGLEQIAEKVRQRLQLEQRDIDPQAPGPLLYVYGEPALLFQLRSMGEPLVTPANSIPRNAAQFQDRVLPTYLLSGLHAARDPSFLRPLAEASSDVELVARFEYRPSWLVLLDQYHPRQLREDRTGSVQLFAIRKRAIDASPAR